MQGRRRLPLAVFVLTGALTIAVAFWWHRDRQASTPPASVLSVAANAAGQPATRETPDPAFGKLTGLWQRPDGGYLIEIRSVGPDGEMDAAYFNPRPVNVAKAEAYHDRGAIGIFIELRDRNYPGSKYNLQYDPLYDRLTGLYFQAVQKVIYEVEFVRTK